MVEAAGAITALWLWQRSTGVGEFLLGSTLLSYFAVVLVIDLEHRLILHPVSLAGVILGLGAGLWRHDIISTLAGGLAGFTIMFVLYLLGGIFIRMIMKRTRRSVDEVALGFGDVALASVLGLLLGWPGIVPGLILAIVLGGLASLIYLSAMLISRRYQPFSAIPYGPFLVASAVLLLYFKELLISLFNP
jgi:leader peptidase (prepilin peptidase)/N-methyltransferase